MTIEFYNVKKREKVQIAKTAIEKVSYEKETKTGKTQIRYALKAIDEGTKLTKFCSKETWDSL